MGTASMAHGSATVSHPVQQGLMGIMEVFLDTIVICTMTALVILVSGVPIAYGTDVGAVLTTQAFCAIYGNWVSWFLTGALCCFAFATVLGWGLYGARCAEFLFGANVWKQFAFVQAVAVVVGAVLHTGTVWLLSEIMNGLMAVPNLIILLALSPELVRLTKQFEQKTAQTCADGGTYESFNQCKPLRTLSYAEIPSHGGEGAKSGKNHLSSEYRPAGHQDTGSLL
jgi:AGCS family alanine or glycine:cation symporter